MYAEAIVEESRKWRRNLAELVRSWAEERLRTTSSESNRPMPGVPRLEPDGGVVSASSTGDTGVRPGTRKVDQGERTDPGLDDEDDTGRFGMVIDLKKCVACYGCVASCEVENFLPKNIFWSWIESKDLPNGWVKDETLDRLSSFERVHVPMLCMHCGDPAKGETAPCQDVCPTGATEKLDDGTVTIDPTKCIGCGYCLQACPYGARMKIPENPQSYFPAGTTDRERFQERFPEDDHRRHPPGTVGKCEFCKHRTGDGMDPKCVTNCIGNARFFGDINDPESEVSRLIEEYDGFQISPDMGTNPAVYYLPPDRHDSPIRGE